MNGDALKASSILRLSLNAVKPSLLTLLYMYKLAVENTETSESSLLECYTIKKTPSLTFLQIPCNAKYEGEILVFLTI